MGNLVTSKKKKQKPDLISNIPEDILLTILLKLRLVSKLFNLTVSNSEFISLYHESPGESNTYDLLTYHSDNTSSGLYFTFIHENDLLSKDLGIPFQSINGSLRNVGSVKGIICLYDHNSHVGTVNLWNPVVGKVKVLPSFVGPDDVFEYVTVGFGYDCKNLDFKVVMVLYSGIRPHAFVYGLKDEHWTSINGDVPCCMPPNIWCESVFVDGVVHWLAYDSPEEFDTHPNCIMTFDFADEVFKVVGLPENRKPSTVKELKLCVTADEKSVVLFVSDGDVGELYLNFTVWIMSGNNWTKKFHAQVDDEFVPQGMLRNGQVIGAIDSHLLVLIDVEMRGGRTV